MTLEEMKKRQEDFGYTEEEIAALSGVPLDTVQKIFRGEETKIRYNVLSALQGIFREKMVVMESSPAYHTEHKPGQYTIDDYRALPDDQRVELIDGYFYDMAAPTTFHQLMAGELHRQIANFILEEGGSCVPFISPVDVQLDNDEKTMIQPDVVIVCDTDKIIRRSLLGAPDLVLEVVSPGTKRRDYFLKLAKYEHAGVKEYWIVDPYDKKVIVYFFRDDAFPAIYPIDAEIPVNIYDGRLVLRFQRIAKWAEEKV